MGDDTTGSNRMNRLARAIRQALGQLWEAGIGTPARRAGRALGGVAASAPQGWARMRRPVMACAAAGAAGWALWTHPPVKEVPRGELAVRSNRLTGGASEFRAGTVLVVPGLHELRLYE